MIKPLDLGGTTRAKRTNDGLPSSTLTLPFPLGLPLGRPNARGADAACFLGDFANFLGFLTAFLAFGAFVFAGFFCFAIKSSLKRWTKLHETDRASQRLI